jgi:phosphate acetyltransferase
VSRTIMLIPTGTSVGLTSVSLGVIRSMEQKGVQPERVQTHRPATHRRRFPDQTTTIIRANSSIPAAEPLRMSSR